MRQRAAPGRRRRPWVHWNKLLATAPNHLTSQPLARGPPRLGSGRAGGSYPIWPREDHGLRAVFLMVRLRWQGRSCCRESSPLRPQPAHLIIFFRWEQGEGSTSNKGYPRVWNCEYFRPGRSRHRESATAFNRLGWPGPRYASTRFAPSQSKRPWQLIGSGTVHGRGAPGEPSKAQDSRWGQALLLPEQSSLASSVPSAACTQITDEQNNITTRTKKLSTDIIARG